MEVWDLYDEKRSLTGRTMTRGERVPTGCFHLVVDALFLNGKGETLLQLRAKEKPFKPNTWSVTGGSALQGEDSAAACRREVSEEMGFEPDFAKGRVMLTEINHRRSILRDVYLFQQDVALQHMRYQPEEVQQGLWILPEDIKKDAQLWRELSSLSFWDKVYPYLCLESMRIRIPAGVYRHYKGNRYAVEGLALHSETLEPMVIYRALYGQGETWVRPAAMWNEQVTAAGQMVRRFTLEKTE